MATTQEALDVKYELLRIEEEEKMETLFSQYLLGWTRNNGLESFTQIQAFNGSMEINSSSIDLKGIKHFKQLTEIDIGDCVISNLTGISSLVHLTNIEITNSGLESIESLSNLKLLTHLYLYRNSLSSIDLAGLEGITHIYLWDNNLTSVSGLGNLGSLVYFNVKDNQLPAEMVDELLQNLEGVYYTNASLQFVDLRGNSAPSEGDIDVFFETLIDEGVVVHIEEE